MGSPALGATGESKRTSILALTSTLAAPAAGMTVTSPVDPTYTGVLVEHAARIRIAASRRPHVRSRPKVTPAGRVQPSGETASVPAYDCELPRGVAVAPRANTSFA